MANPMLKNIAYSLYFFLLTTCLFSWAFALSASDTFFERSFYTGFLAQNKMYSSMRATVLNITASNLAPAGNLEARDFLAMRLESVVTEKYFDAQINGLLYEALDYASESKPEFEPAVDLVPVKDGLATAVIEAYAQAGALNLSNPASQSAIAQQKLALLILIPNSITAQTFSSSKEFSQPYSNVVRSLNSARVAHNTLAQTTSFLPFAILVLVILLFVALKNPHQFFRRLSWPVASTGLSLILASFFAPSFVAQSLPNIVNSYQLPPESAALISNFISMIFLQMFSKLLNYGLIFLVLGAVLFLLSKFVFSKEATEPQSYSPWSQQPKSQNANNPQT